MSGLPEAPLVGLARTRTLSGLPGPRAARPRKPWIRKLREPWPGAMESVEFGLGGLRIIPVNPRYEEVLAQSFFALDVLPGQKQQQWRHRPPR